MTSDDPVSDAPRAERAARAAGRTETTMVAGLWMTLGTGIQGLLTVVVLAVVSRLLKPEDFGVVSASLLVVNFSLIFSQVGVGPAIVQHPKLRREHLETGFILSMLFSLACVAVLSALAPVIAMVVHAPKVTPILRTLAWLLMLQGVSVVSESQLRRALEFRTIASIRVVSYLVGYGAVGIIAALLGAGAWALVAASTAQTLISTVMLVRSKPIAWGWRIDGAAWRELASFGGGFALARIGNYAAVYGDNSVTAATLGVRALGLYDRAYQLMAMPAGAIGQVIDDVLFPAMAQVQQDPVRVGRAYRRCVAAVALLTLPATGLAVLLAPEMFKVLFGAQWTAAILPFRILALGTLFRTSYKVSDSLSRAMGAVYRRAWRQWIYAGCVIAGAWVGQHRGLAGVAVGVVLALLVNFVLMAELSLRLVGTTHRSLITAHIPALRTTVLLLVPAWIVVDAARHFVPPLAVLAAATICVLATSIVLYRMSPSLLLGEDGRWLAARIDILIRTRIGRVFARQPAQVGA
jgi:PST family polysaccharide transporter